MTVHAQDHKKRELVGSIRMGWDVKRSVRNDKRKYIDNLAKEAESAASQQNMKKLYETTRQLSSRFQTTNHQIRDANGNL